MVDRINDIAIGPDHAAYVSDTGNNAIYRVAPGATEGTLFSNARQIFGIDGLTFMDGVLYATTPKLRVVALDASTGREIWSFDPSGGAGGQRRYRHRGVTVYRDRVFFTYRNFLYALDRQTGKYFRPGA